MLDGTTLRVRGRVVAGPGAAPYVDGPPVASPYALDVDERWEPVAVPGPPTAAHLRAAGLAERAVLLEGALAAAGADRVSLARDGRVRAVLLDVCALSPSGAVAGARVEVGASGRVERVTVRVAAGDPLDDVVLRSYAIGGAHMALGWVLSEELAVDDAGAVHDLTIRSFGVIKPKDTPPIEVEIVDDDGPPLGRASDAVFAAVAAAAWNAISAAVGPGPMRSRRAEPSGADRAVEADGEVVAGRGALIWIPIRDRDAFEQNVRPARQVIDPAPVPVGVAAVTASPPPFGDREATVAPGAAFPA